MRHRIDHQGVAVGWGTRDDFRAYGAGGAAAVVDDELLTQVLGNFLEDDAPGDVSESARRPWRDDTHGFGGPGLGLREEGEAGDKKQRSGAGGCGHGRYSLK